MRREFRLALTQESMHALGERVQKLKQCLSLSVTTRRQNQGMSQLDNSQATGT